MYVSTHAHRYMQLCVHAYLEAPLVVVGEIETLAEITDESL